MRLRSFVALLAAAALSACTARKPDQPSIQLSDIGFTLHLPAPMQAALNAYAPGFHAITTDKFRSDIAQRAAETGQLPAMFAAVGDFDRDGNSDAIVEGTTPDDPALQVIAVLNGPHPKAMTVTEFPSYDADAVGIFVAGLSGGRFEIANVPDSTVVYRWAGGSFSGVKKGS